MKQNNPTELLAITFPYIYPRNYPIMTTNALIVSCDFPHDFLRILTHILPEPKYLIPGTVSLIQGTWYQLDGMYWWCTLHPPYPTTCMNVGMRACSRSIRVPQGGGWCSGGTRNSWMIINMYKKSSDNWSITRSFMVHGSRLMAHASRLVAQGSWSRQIWR